MLGFSIPNCFVLAYKREKGKKIRKEDKRNRIVTGERERDNIWNVVIP